MENIIIVFAIVLESIRMLIVGNEMWKIARKKAESPVKWIASAVAMWIGIELSTIFLSVMILGREFMLVGLFIGIGLASFTYRFFRRKLKELPDSDWEDKIDQIGK
jgi:predicted PurR-regulated permease PerM